MRFQRLRLDGLRCLSAVDIAPAAGINLLVGPNGAGKTSFLEGIFLLSYARSFRPGALDGLVNRERRHCEIHGELLRTDCGLVRVGLGRADGQWTVRINGSPAPGVTALFEYCAVVCFEPGSHALIAGPAQERRRFMDWGVFHVEHEFLSAWRRYRRALRQRNALLRERDGLDDRLLDPWESELDTAATAIHRCREAYIERLKPAVGRLTDMFLPELGPAVWKYWAGWNLERSLADTLRQSRDRDRQRGYTGAGIHRADWQVAFAAAPERTQLSRGQEKLCALACVLAQARLFAADHGEWPVVVLDDLASELDDGHQHVVLAELEDSAAQVFVTGTNAGLADRYRVGGVFHVEHGHIKAVGDAPAL